MKNVIGTLGALAVVLAAISANAQNSTHLSVPFAFTAAGQTLPAGEYRVSLDQSSDVVTLSGQDLTTIFLLTAPGDSLQDDRRVLRFLHSGNEWSLQGIGLDGMIRQVPSTRTKKD